MTIFYYYTFFGPLGVFEFATDDFNLAFIQFGLFFDKVETIKCVTNLQQLLTALMVSFHFFNN